MHVYIYYKDLQIIVLFFNLSFKCTVTPHFKLNSFHDFDCKLNRRRTESNSMYMFNVRHYGGIWFGSHQTYFTTSIMQRFMLKNEGTIVFNKRVWKYTWYTHEILQAVELKCKHAMCCYRQILSNTFTHSHE